jgi:uncharacterized membrane protein (GlpM family)
MNKQDFWNGFVGGIVFFAVLALNKLLGPTAAAIISWFPIFTISGIIFAYKLNQARAVKEFLIGGIWSILFLLIFSIVIAVGIVFAPLVITLILAVSVWLISALIFIRANSKEIQE